MRTFFFVLLLMGCGLETNLAMCAAGTNKNAESIHNPGNMTASVNFAGDVFIGGREGPSGTSHYRIPALEIAPDGSVLAFAEGRRSGADPGQSGFPIDMVMKRSLDGGKHWGKLVVLHHNPAFDYSDPRPLTDWRTNQVHLLYMQWPDDCGQQQVPAGLGSDSSVVLHQVSRDNGRTWQGPFNLNTQVKNPHWRALNVGPGIGIQLRWQKNPAKNGRLVVPAHRQVSNKDCQGVALYSDDGGNTWHSGKPQTGPQLNESEIIELTNGDLLWDGRQARGDYRVHHISHDGGQSWEYLGVGDIKITRVDCALLRYSARREGDDRDRLIFAGPLGKPLGSGRGRFNMGIWTSYDEGKSFINPILVAEGFAAYSAIQKLKDGTIGLLYEKTGSTRITYINFTISQVESGLFPASLAQYDGFGNRIMPLRGGTGWTGPWQGSSSFTGKHVLTVDSASIRFKGYPFQTQPGRLVLKDGDSVERLMAEPVDLNANNIYVSLLISRALESSPDKDGGFLRIQLRNNHDTVLAGWGINSRADFYLNLPEGAQSTASGYLEHRESFLLLAKLGLQKQGRARIKYINMKIFRSGQDIIPAHEMGLNWSLIGKSVPKKIEFPDRISLKCGGSGGWSIDEIRIGTSYEAVAGRAK